MDTDTLTDIILSEMEDDGEIPKGLSKRSSKSKEGRGTKIKRSAGQMATYDARRKNDLLYNKMIHYRDLYYKYRDMIKKKYRDKNVKRARG